MELFINQGKDSTIEPAYLTETKQTISEPTLISKTITENDTYNAVDDNADGYSSVTVNVATPVPETYEVVINVPEPSDPTINHTYAEIASAFNSGKSIIGEVNLYGYEQPLNIVYSFKDDIRYLGPGTDVVLTDAIVLQTNCFDIVGRDMPSMFLTFIIAQDQGVDIILYCIN
jgi:hypothetical protein